MRYVCCYTCKKLVCTTTYLYLVYEMTDFAVSDRWYVMETVTEVT